MASRFQAASVVIAPYYSNAFVWSCCHHFESSIDIWTGVAGLAWAFDGCCLYGCNQDNFVSCWILHGNSLFKVPILHNAPGLKSSTDLPYTFISCLSVAVSPGDLVVAMVHSFDLNALDPLY